MSKVLADTGNEYTWIPEKALERIGVTREKKDLPFVLRTDAFEERLESSFDVYARIARNVTTSLGRELTGEDEAILATAESSDFDAFDLYLLGVELLPEED